MKTKIFLLAMVLAIALSALAVAQTNDDNDGTPLPSQTAQAGKSSTLNATNTASGITGTIGADAGDISRFFNRNATVSSSDRDVITRRASDVFGSYSTSDFVMSRADFDNAVSQRSGDLYIIDVGAAGSRNIANANMIGIRDLPGRISGIPDGRTSGIPDGRTVAVFADNDIDGTVAVTLLRLEGYNAWIVSSGTTTTGTTGFAGTTGTTGVTGTSGATSQSGTPLPTQY